MAARRRKGIARSLAGLTAGLMLVGLAFWRGLGPTTVQRAQPVSGIEELNPGLNPDGYALDLPVFGDGKPSTLADAKKALGGYLPLPDSSDASAANIEQVWVNSGAGEVDIYFSSGLRLLMEPRPELSKAVVEEEAQAIVSQNGGASELATINDVIAIVTARDFAGNDKCGVSGADCIPKQRNPSDVYMILNGVSVELDADWPIDQVIAVASTMS
jgi:hypothetical protein